MIYLIFTPGCGSTGFEKLHPKQTTNHEKSDPSTPIPKQQIKSIYESIEKFEGTTGHETSHLKVLLHSNCNVGVGRCFNFAKSRAVSLNRDYLIREMKREHPLVMELLVFHELGHCVLDRSHSVSPSADTILGSVMAGVTKEKYAMHADYYLEELIDPDAPKLDFQSLPVDPEDICDFEEI